MPPGVMSRYQFCRAVRLADGRVFLTDREPYTFRDFVDNRRHTVTQGDDLWTIAASHFASDLILRPSDLFWVVADFQPVRVIDPTIRLAACRVIHVPSFRTLFEEIFSERRRVEHL